MMDLLKAMKIYVSFIGSDFVRYIRALRRLSTIAGHQLNDLPYRQALDYVDLVRKNINSNRYAGRYSPYSKRYADWKYNIFKATGGFWILRGELESALKTFKIGKGWMGGLPAGVTDSGNVSWLGAGDKGRPVPIALYGQWMEYGRRGQPPRPVFQPSLDEYGSSGAIKRGIESLKRIRSGWR